MTETEFAAWLDAYKQAWEEQDPAAVIGLFTPDATYREVPFDPPMRGRDEIEAYWRKNTVDAQSKIRFDYEIYAVTDVVGLCHWWCAITSMESGERIEFDGIFRCVFTENGEGLRLCHRFEEWWHERVATHPRPAPCYSSNATSDVAGTSSFARPASPVSSIMKAQAATSAPI